jgi:hypothetical protein
MDWDLIGWSFTVIRRNKQLALFPAFSAAAALAGLWLFAEMRYGGLAPLMQKARFGLDDYAWLLPAWFLVNFVIIFFNCALAACADAAMTGAKPTVGYGLGQAAARVGRIAGWALISTTVGLLLDAIERRLSFFGKLTTWVFGFAWATVSYLVVPVLIAEDHGTLGAVRRSAQLARKTWGDQIVAAIRFGWRTLFVFIPCVVLFVAALNGHLALLPFAAVYLVIAAAVMSAAQGIFEVALYRYAARGETPADWTSARMPELFR